MTNTMNLMKAWDACSDEEIGSFISLLDAWDAKFHVDPLSEQEDCEGAELLGSPELHAAVIVERIKKVEQHKLFKVLKQSPDFMDAYKWLNSAKAPAIYKTPEGKLCFLESLVIAFSIHAKRAAGAWVDFTSPRARDMVQRIKAKAQALLNEIEKSQTYLEQPLFECCGRSRAYLAFMVNYQQKAYANATYLPRNFLYELIRGFLTYDLPRSPKLIELLLPMIGETSLGDDQSNLRKKIRECEIRIATDNATIEADWR